MNWYYAKEGQQVGPVDETELARLVSDKSIIGTTLVWREGLAQWQPYQEVWVAGMPDWRSASSAGTAVPPPASPPVAPVAPLADGQAACSECRQAFPADQLVLVAGRSVCSGCRPALLQKLQAGASDVPKDTEVPSMDPETLVRCSAARGTSLDVMACFHRSWDFFKREPLLSIGSVAISTFLMMAGGMIPILSFCIGLLVNTPLMGGVWSLFVKALRGERVSLEEVFSGFSKRWLPLVLAGVVQLLVAAVVIGPFAGLLAFWLHGHRGASPAGLDLVAIVVVGTVLFLLSIYVNLALFFSIPLMMDRGYGVMDALNTSRRIVNQNFLGVVLMALMSFVLVICGTLAICLGLVIAVPVIMGMWAAAYEELCGSRVKPN